MYVQANCLIVTSLRLFQNVCIVALDSISHSIVAKLTSSFKVGCHTQRVSVLYPWHLLWTESRKQNSLERGCWLWCLSIWTHISAFSLLILNKKLPFPSLKWRLFIFQIKYLSFSAVFFLIFTTASKLCPYTCILLTTFALVFFTLLLSSMASAAFSTSDHVRPSLIMVVSLAVRTAEGFTIECVLKNSSRSLCMCRLGLWMAVHVCFPMW